MHDHLYSYATYTISIHYPSTIHAFIHTIHPSTSHPCTQLYTQPCTHLNKPKDHPHTHTHTHTHRETHTHACSYVYAYTDTPHTHIHAYTYIIHAHRDAQTVCRIGCRQLRQVIPPTHTHTHLQITHQSTLPLAALVSLTNSMYPFAAPLPLSYDSSILSEHPTTISPTPPMFVQSVQELVCRGHAQRERCLRRCSLYAMWPVCDHSITCHTFLYRRTQEITAICFTHAHFTQGYTLCPLPHPVEGHLGGAQQANTHEHTSCAHRHTLYIHLCTCIHAHTDAHLIILGSTDMCSSNIIHTRIHTHTHTHWHALTLTSYMYTFTLTHLRLLTPIRMPLLPPAHTHTHMYSHALKTSHRQLHSLE